MITEQSLKLCGALAAVAKEAMAVKCWSTQIPWYATDAKMAIGCIWCGEDVAYTVGELISRPFLSLTTDFADLHSALDDLETVWKEWVIEYELRSMDKD